MYVVIIWCILEEDYGNGSLLMNGYIFSIFQIKK